ncbi:MAG TPA: CsgG/HfaB family protein [Nitrospinota bacterium]|nr:CsgG/HfaB family protein [Nitrospinota bacterium]
MRLKNKRPCFMVFVVMICVILWHVDVLAGQYKKTIAVSRFENRTNASGQANLGSGMADQLADSLIQSGKFVVLERQTLEDIIGEQDLAASGRAAVSKTARTGKLVPAQILIKGTVTEFDSKSGSSGAGVGFGGFNIGSKKTTAHVAVILRLIDTTTGVVLDSKRVEGKSEGSGLKLGVGVGGFDFGTEGFKRTPLGKAMQITIDKAVVEVTKKLDQLPYTGKIIKVTEDVIYTNIGERNGVSVGDLFNVYSRGEELIDPDTGENLGSEKTKVGSIKINSVKEKFSKAIPETGEIFKKGLILTE